MIDTYVMIVARSVIVLAVIFVLVGLIAWLARRRHAIKVPSRLGLIGFPPAKDLAANAVQEPVDLIQ